MASVTRAGDENVPLVNPSFETPAPKQGDLPPGWKTWSSQIARAAGAAVTWEPSAGRNHSRCVAVRGAAGSVCVIQQAPVQPGRPYVCSVWAKQSNPKSRCEVSIRWAKADRSWAGTGSVSEPITVGAPANEWMRIDVQFAPIPEAAYAVIMLTANEQGPADTCWFDDVELRALEPGALVVSSLRWMHPNLAPLGTPVATPHVPWARPLAGGKLRVLFLCRASRALREPFELAQRLDVELDYAVAGYEDRGGWYAANNAQIMDRLRQRFYDVAVVSGRLEAETLAGLAARCRGLVLVGSVGKLPAAVRWSPLPKEHDLAATMTALPSLEVAQRDGTRKAVPAVTRCRLGTLGDARLVEIVGGGRRLDLTPDVGFEEHLRLGACYWEAYWQFLAKAVLQAAGRSSAASVSARFAGQRFALSIDATAPLAGQLEIAVADSLHRLRSLQPMPVQAEPSKPWATLVAIPTDLPHGAVACLATLRDVEGGAVAFACARGQVTPPTAIAAVEPDKPFYEEGQPVRARVRIKNPGPRLTVKASLTDAFGRTHAQHQAPATSPEAELVLDASARLSALNWLDVTLVSDGRSIDAARWYVLVPLARKKWLADYQVGTWADATAVPAYAQPALGAMLRQIGVSEGLQGPGGYLAMLASGMWPISIAYGGVPGFRPHDGDGTERRPCLSDPEIRSKMAEAACDVTQRDLPYRPLFGYLHDETSLVSPAKALDVCSCRFCLDRYRQWLRSKYASLDELNRQWQTAYANWDELGFTTFRQVRGKQSFAPWLMYRSFMDWTWSEGVQWAKRHARQADPQAMLSLANTFGPNPFSGRDYWLLSQANDFWMEYTTETRSPMPGGAIRHNFDAVRSFSQGQVNHPWVGYRFDDEYIRFAVWFTALHGASGAAPYGALSLAPPQGSWALVWPTLQHTRRGLLYQEELRPLKAGIGRLLMGARRAPAPVAILWSQPGMYVAWAMSDQEEHPGGIAKQSCYRQFFLSRQAFRQSVLAGARQFDYVCEEQVLAGRLGAYRALALPAAYAMSEALAEKIERFAAAGGTVVADMGCGLTNEVGARWPGESPAERLFGFRRKAGPLTYGERKLPLPLGDGGRSVKVACLGGEDIEPGAGVTCVRDAAGRPAFLQRRVGRGRAVLLNCAAPYAPELAGLWAELPVIARVERQPAELELVLLEHGPARYLGALYGYMNVQENCRTRLGLADSAHVYDTRAGTYLGPRDAVDLDLAPGACALYSLLPYRVEALRVQARPEDSAGWWSVDCVLRTAGKPQPGPHVFRLEVLDPQGSPVEHYGQNLVAEHGQATAAIGFALNDGAGTWTVRVRDVASGVSAHTMIERR